MAETNQLPTETSVEELLKVQNNLETIEEEMFIYLTEPLKLKGFENWKEFQKAKTTSETNIKEAIKAGVKIEETDRNIIKKTLSYAYDVEKFKELTWEKWIDYIKVEEKVNKTEVDKAIKKGLLEDNLEDALVLNSIKVEFKNKAVEEKKNNMEVTI